MATGWTGSKQAELFWLLAMMGPLFSVPVASVARAQTEPPPAARGGFSNGGLLGENPFKSTEQPQRTSASANEDWSYQPSNAAKYLRRGDACLEGQEYEMALRWYHGAVLCDPFDMNARRKQGLASYYLSDYENAFRDVDVVIRTGPSEGSDYGLRALLRCMNAKPEDGVATDAAELDNKRCLVAEPKSPRARGVAGIIAFRRGNCVQSVADLCWAIENGCDLVEFRFFLGQAYLSLERFADAIAQFERVTRAKHPGTAAGGHVFLAFCHAAMGEPQKALVDYKKAIDLWPTDDDLRSQRIELAMTSGCFNVALEELDFLVPRHPNDEGVFWCRALLYLLDGRDPGLAVADLDKAIAIEPRLAFFYAARAVAHLKQKEYVRSLGDVARTWVASRFCELNLTYGIDFRARRFYLGIDWDLREEPRGNQGNDAENLSRKLVDIGLGSLLGSKPGKPNLN